MINFILKSVLLLSILLVVCCDNNSDLNPITACPEDALHTINNAKGHMTYLYCYEAWAVVLDESLHDDAQTIIANLFVHEDYRVDSMRVKIDACLYEFDLPLLLPDPAPWGYLYRMDNVNMNLE